METIFYSSWRDMVTFSAEEPQLRALVDDEGLKVVIVGFLPGQSIPPHPESRGIFYILEGSGWMTVAEERLAVKAGATVIVPDGVARGFEAETQMAVLVTRVAS